MHRAGDERRSYGSRITSAIFAITITIGILCLLFIRSTQVPASPTVEPIVANLVFQPSRPHDEFRLPRASPRLVRVTLQPPDRPPNFDIKIPMEVAPPRERSNIPASYSVGNGAKPEDSAGAQGRPKVLVTGEQPGPPLWKVTSVASPQHVLWILGEPPTPLPAKVVWRSKQVEAVLAHAQEVILDGLIIFRPAPEPLEYQVMRTLPSPQTLKNVLPEDLYRRFSALKVAFASSDHELDHLRPWAAAVALRDDTLKSLSLTNTAVPRTVLRDASWRVRVVSVVTYADIAVLERNSKSPRTVSCLEKMVSDLDTDRDDLKELANAWSVGEIEVLRELQKPDECFPTLFDSDQQAKDMAAQHTGQWLATAELALKKRQNTFALVPMSKLLAPDSWLTALRADGYHVDGPRWQ